METILIVDDEAGFRTLAQNILAGEGYSVETAASVEEALTLGSLKQFHLALASLDLPNGRWPEVLRSFGRCSPGTPVVVIRAAGSGNSAIQAMKSGAVGYLDKPLASPDELKLRVRHALDDRLAEQERAVLREEGSARLACGTLIAGDHAMSDVVALAGKVAPLEVPILLTGPSGTGRETLARYIHGQSRRAGAAFVSVNCAGAAPANLETKLFGQEESSPAETVELHPGYIERAEKGTLLLREVGELDGTLQSKLLGVLRDRAFERPASGRRISVDIRLIASTRRDISKMVADGKFREDLFGLLSTFRLSVPSLKERPADIPVLARCFLARAAQRLGKRDLKLTPDAIDALARHPWPGNVRELENTMERAAMACESEIGAEDLLFPRTNGSEPVRWREIERKAIERALHANAGNRTHAARQLGISLRKLQYRLKEYGLSDMPPLTGVRR